MLALFNSINSAVCGVLGINSYLQGVIIMVCINVIAVLGMSVLTGFTRLFSFGNAGFMSIGAYTAAILAVKFNVKFSAGDRHWRSLCRFHRVFTGIDHSAAEG